MNAFRHAVEIEHGELRIELGHCAADRLATSSIRVYPLGLDVELDDGRMAATLTDGNAQSALPSS